MDRPGTIHIERHTASPTRLRGHWRLIVLAFWVALALPLLSSFVAGLFLYTDQLSTLCYGVGWDCASGQLTPEQTHALEDYGLSLDIYVTVVVTLTASLTMVWYTVALVIAWRKSDDWMALLVALMLLSFGVFINVNPAAPNSPLSQAGATFTTIAAFILLLLVCTLFPDGRFVPHWTRWLMVVFIASAGISFIDTGSELPWRVLMLTLALLLGSLVIAQIYRFRRVSTYSQRTQTKWVVVGMSVAILVLAGTFMLSGVATVIPGDPHVRLATSITLGVISLLIPITFGIAVLRYRLFDIDTLINRTMVYGTLTGLLAMIYIGGVLVLQTLLHTITNQTSSIALVVSTLVTVALVQPLRRRVQQSIDRRFYRRKYDAARTLTTFSATLQNKVDLEHLHAELVGVVQRTMQPTHVSLWLSPPRRQTKHATSPAES